MEGFKASNLNHNPDLVVVGNVIRAIYEEQKHYRGHTFPIAPSHNCGTPLSGRSHSVVVAVHTVRLQQHRLQVGYLNPPVSIRVSLSVVSQRILERSARPVGGAIFCNRGG